MNEITFPLKLQMKSPEVANLHEALAFLGLTIADGEKTNQRYGASTRTAVTKFQTGHNLPVTGAVDEATANAINTELSDKGALDPGPGSVDPPVPPLPAEPKLFSIQGEVVQPDGKPIPNQVVRAYDRALCEWRQLGDAEAIARTNDRGQYVIAYDPAQLRQWGKTRADLKVEIRDPTGDTVLAESPLILRALPRETVNFSLGVQPYRGPDEFSRLEKALAPLLAGHDADLGCLLTPDVLILARQAGVATSKAAWYVKARRWAATLGLPAALFYGLLRGGAPTRIDALLARPLARLWAQLQEASSRNVIGLALSLDLRGQLAQVQQGYLSKPEHPYAQLLATTALGADKQSAFTRRLTTGEASGEALWQALQAEDGFSADEVVTLQQTFELQTVVGDNTSLSVALRGMLGVRTAREVAAFSADHWRDTVLGIDTVQVPDDVLPEGTPAERQGAYAQMLYRAAERRYPTTSLAGQMARDAQWASSPLLSFFSIHPTFEFTDQRLLNFLRARPDALQGLPPSARDDLLRVEQLFHLTPGEDKLSLIQPMWDAGLRTAPQLASLGRAGLARRLAGKVDTKTAQRMYRKAVHVTSLALSVYLRFNPSLNRLSLATLRPPQAPAAQTTTPALARSAIALPEWQELFGSPDACECSHCESALSPAAYLVSIMAFLERAVDANGHNALDELLARRPDLGTLQLSCENTETLVPHIDLAIEILESIVASINGQTLLGTDIGPTTWDTDLLAAQPEYLRTAAYDIVRLSAYPLRSLPFDLWAEEGRRYLKRMGIAREALMLAMPAMPGVGALQRATEALGMSRLERELIAQPKSAPAALAPAWGYDSAAKLAAAELGTVANLLTRAAIDYDTLLRLLNTRYLNPGHAISVRFDGTPCAVEGAVLIDAAGAELAGAPLRTLLDRMHRFLRLQARLDADEYTIDTLIQALAVGDFDAPQFFEKLAAMQALRRDLRVGLAEMSSWWAATLDTHVFEQELPSQYESIYLDAARFPATHAGSGVDLRNAVFALRADRNDLAITTSTDTSLSPWLAESDGAAAPTYTVQADYGAYIQGATRLTGDDLLLFVGALLPKDAGTGHVSLNLANLSLLFRLATFTRAAKLSATDLIRLMALTGRAPLRVPPGGASPLDTQRFIDVLKEVHAAELSIEQLAYLHLHEADAVAAWAPSAEAAEAWRVSMVNSFKGIVSLDDAALTDALKSSLAQSLGSTLGLDPAALEALLFTHRLPLGDELLAHMIVAANEGSAGLPVPNGEYPAVFEQVAKFGLAWNSLQLDLSFLAFVVNTGPALGWADIAVLPVTVPSAVTFEAWRRLVSAAALQNSTFTLDASLFALIEQATAQSAEPTSFVLDDFLVQLSAWTTWPLADVTYLTGPAGFNLTLPDAMRDERALLDMKQVFDLIRTSGVSAAQAHSWTIEELGYLQTQAIKQALSPAFAPERWLDVLGAIQDELRTLKRDALLGHALTHLGMKNADEFYAQYLIDPAMSPADRTSRIVLAHSAVQLFVQRILLNLEGYKFEKADATAWQWQQNYRVWEAARRVFLTPENWLEPEWRDDKSTFFRELEDALDQEDVTAESAERIYLDYLRKVDQVSRLEILGSYEESWTVGDTDTVHLHVVGRTQEVPPAYYYRRLEDRVHWTPWERIQLDMTGDHLIPLAYNGKLYLFWPEFKVTESDAPSAADQSRDEVAAAQQEIADIQNAIDAKNREILQADLAEQAALFGELVVLGAKLSEAQADYDALIDEDGSVQVDPDIEEPLRYEVELGMSWCTFGPNGTSPKQRAREALAYATNVEPEWHHFSGWVSGDNLLRIAVRTTHSAEPDIGYFYLDNINGELHASKFLSGAPVGEVSAAGAMQRFQALELVYFSGGEPRLELNIAGDSWHGQLLAETASGATRALDTTVDVREVQVPHMPQVRTLLNKLTDGYGRIHYLHQFGLGGNAGSPFFFSTNLGSYFVQLEEVLALPVYRTTGARVASGPTRSGASAASRLKAPPRAAGPSGLVNDPYYQHSGTEIVDRGLTSTAGATLQSTTSLVSSILVEDAVPIELADLDRLDTNTKYRFTRFADPNTSLFLRQVSRHGVAGLLSPDPTDDTDSETLYRQLLPLDTFDFAATYAPNSGWVAVPYPMGKIDFEHGSPCAWSNWELFFHIPLMIAARLMRNERFAEARLWLHHIFDPTAADEDGPEGFWKIKPFYEEQQGGALQSLDALLTDGNTAYERQLQTWEADPFQPHAIARLRTSAYMQAVVMRYLSSLISEADMLFRRDTREFIDKARQLYVLAGSILGERPTLLPAQEASAMTPNLLLNRFRFEWNGLPGGNPLDSLTSSLSAGLPGASTTPKRSTGLTGGALTVEATVASSALAASFGGTGQATTLGSASGIDTLLLMCIPHNDVLYGYWDLVADRLFKIRHSMNLSGQVRQLALFAPPIDPAMLVRAAAAGLDIEAVFGGLFAPRSNYRFGFMLQKALELCGEARNLGQMLLAALEKRDAEQLSLLRSTHEVGLLDAIRGLKMKAVDEAKAGLAGLTKTRASAEFRRDFYLGLERVSKGEQQSLNKQEDSREHQKNAEITEVAASVLHIIPTFIGLQPSFGGSHLGSAAQAFAASFRGRAAALTYEAGKAGTMAGYDRRIKDWRLQADLAKREIDQLDSQILAAEIRHQIAETDLANHDQQIEQAKQVEDFLKLKFSNQQLYGWMVSKLASVHFQAYQLAYQTALQAQSAFQHELGPDEQAAVFIKPDNWDSLKKGLMAGELLQLQLRQMETAHLAANKRELEITKHVSLLQLDPLALLKLRETGSCEFHLPEVLFDMDFPGHYFRRIKAVRVSVPCVVGPYTNVSATLRLSSSWTRRNTDLADTAQPIPDDVGAGPTAVAISSANQDGGMFELSFGDPRYLPFEGAGAVSSWELELPTAVRAFDYDTITDVVFHVSYTAREATDPNFKVSVNAQFESNINTWGGGPLGNGASLTRMLSLRHEFSGEWNRLLYPSVGEEPEIVLQLGKQHFPKCMDYLWEDTNVDGRAETAKPIAIQIDAVDVYLNPSGLLPSDVDNVTLNGRSPTVDTQTGLTVFDSVAVVGTITNATGVEVTIAVDRGELRAEEWRDIYVVLKYQIAIQ